jgi:UDP-sulfoquinovose synthase
MRYTRGVFTLDPILVLGGDGYCGWATSLHLSACGHQVVIVDNLSRRRFDTELGIQTLTPIASIEERVAAWQQVSNRRLGLEIGDLCDWDFVADIFARYRPRAVVHFAEQRSAPFSMMDRGRAIFTQENNVIGTLNVLFALHEFSPAAHLVKLGTMGEYGTPNIDIEEGFIDIDHKGRRDRLPYPKQPGSWYHLSKVHDSHNITFACRLWGLRATDLHQGVVYGSSTPELEGDPRLVNRFDYDEIFGTVLNRFCIQAALGHDLTVYGIGGQTRGFLNLRDTVRCIELALLSPPGAGEYRVFNQFTEQFSVVALARRVSDTANRMGLTPRIAHYPNPRIEMETHYYQACHTSLLTLGLEPHYLNDETIQALIEVGMRYSERANLCTIRPTIRWSQDSTEADGGRRAADEIPSQRSDVPTAS